MCASDASESPRGLDFLFDKHRINVAISRAQSLAIVVGNMNQRQLANRWGVSEATLERWRSDGIGPRYLKLQGRVMYREHHHQTRNPNCYQLGFFIACVPRYRPCAARVYGLRAFLNLGLLKANILQGL
jgi:hypothetical protein